MMEWLRHGKISSVYTEEVAEVDRTNALRLTVMPNRTVRSNMNDYVTRQMLLQE